MGLHDYSHNTSREFCLRSIHKCAKPSTVLQHVEYTTRCILVKIEVLGGGFTIKLCN